MAKKTAYDKAVKAEAEARQAAEKEAAEQASRRGSGPERPAPVDKRGPAMRRVDAEMAERAAEETRQNRPVTGNTDAQVQAEAERRQAAAQKTAGTAQNPDMAPDERSRTQKIIDSGKEKAAKVSKNLRGQAKVIGAEAVKLQEERSFRGFVKEAGDSIMKKAGTLKPSSFTKLAGGVPGIAWGLLEYGAQSTAGDLSQTGAENRQYWQDRAEEGTKHFSIFGPTREEIENENPEWTRSFHDIANDPTGIAGMINTDDWMGLKRREIWSEVQEDLPADGGYDKALKEAQTSVNQASLRGEAEQIRAGVKTGDIVRPEVPDSLPNFSGEASDTIDTERAAEFDRRLEDAGLLTKVEQMRRESRKQRTARQQFITDLNLNPEDSGAVSDALNSFSAYLAEPGILRAMYGSGDTEASEKIRAKALSFFENLNISEESADAFFAGLKSVGMSVEIIQEIGESMGLTSVVDATGEIRNDEEPIIESDDPPDVPFGEGKADIYTDEVDKDGNPQKQTIYSGMVDGVFVAQDTPGAGLTKQYEFANEAGDLRTLEGAQTPRNLREADLASGGPPNPNLPGNRPGDVSSRQRIFDNTKQRQYDSVNADNAAARIRNANTQIDRSTDYSGLPGIFNMPQGANIVSNSRAETPQNLRTRRIGSQARDASLEYADRLEEDLGLLNKEAAQRAGRNIPGMSGAQLAQIPTGQALANMDFRERIGAIYDLDMQAQTNLDRDLSSPQFQARVDQIADRDGNLRDLADRGVRGAAGQLAKARAEATETVMRQLGARHASKVPASLRDTTLEDYDASTAAGQRARAKERKAEIYDRIDDYAAPDTKLNADTRKAAHKWGLLDASENEDLSAAEIEDNVANVFAAEHVINVFEDLTGTIINTRARQAAVKRVGVQGAMVDLVENMAGTDGDFYFREPDLGGWRVFGADRGAWIDQALGAISGGLFGDDTSDDTIIFENRKTGKKITVGDLHGGDREIKTAFQDHFDRLRNPQQ